MAKQKTADIQEGASPEEKDSTTEAKQKPTTKEKTMRVTALHNLMTRLYGPIKKGDNITVPQDLGELWIKQKAAEKYDPAKEKAKAESEAQGEVMGGFGEKAIKSPRAERL